jgi:nucleoid-associated protein YejK
MITPNQITLHGLIIHKIDHVHFTEPVLSDLPSPISEEVDLYLRDEIFFNREHEFSRSGVFTNGTDGKPNLKRLCSDLLKSQEQFVPQSQGIARHLFQVIHGDRRVSPGDLVICAFSEGDDKAKWLALLKMDPQDSFVTEEERVGQNRRLVLKRVRDVMPIGELQKCAFILPESLRDKRRDLIVLDQQQARYGARRLVASFFSKDFLQCRVGLNEREMMQAFMDASYDWIGRKRDVWPDEEIEAFKDALESLRGKRMIRVVAFAHAAIEDPAEQDDYLEKLLQYLRAEKLQDMVFVPAPSLAKGKQVLQIEGDDALTLRINKDAVGQGKTLYYERDQASNNWVITIKTINLRERVYSK